MSDDWAMTDLDQQVPTPKKARAGDDSESEDAMAGGAGLTPSDAAEPTAPPPQEGVAHLRASSGSGELLPEGPHQRTMSRWSEWYLTMRKEYESFEDGERIFEFFDSGRWKPYDKGAQTKLRELLLTSGSLGTTQAVDVDCLGWKYTVQFDLFHQDPAYFADAPVEAIGFQLSNHEKSKLKKRWIRLTTYRVKNS